MIITLLGYMGVGKTTIGEQLAIVLKYQFIDLDAYIEMKELQSVSEVFKTKGEIYFRKQEHFYLQEILSSNKKIVLALGGGTPCYANNMKLISGLGSISFYLQLSPNLLANRLFLEKEKRPLIKNIQSIEKLTEFIGIHLFERQVYYTSAVYTITAANLSVKKITEAIVEKLY